MSKAGKREEDVMLPRPRNGSSTVPYESQKRWMHGTVSENRDGQQRQSPLPQLFGDAQKSMCKSIASQGNVPIGQWAAPMSFGASRPVLEKFDPALYLPDSPSDGSPVYSPSKLDMIWSLSLDPSFYSASFAVGFKARSPRRNHHCRRGFKQQPDGRHEDARKKNIELLIRQIGKKLSRDVDQLHWVRFVTFVTAKLTPSSVTRDLPARDINPAAQPNMSISGKERPPSIIHTENEHPLLTVLEIHREECPPAKALSQSDQLQQDRFKVPPFRHSIREPRPPPLSDAARLKQAIKVGPNNQECPRQQMQCHIPPKYIVKGEVKQGIRIGVCF
ncbi:hypothetical protein ACRALDRAFT_2016778 [Sodiomyces alcalophilus JCM 7366]|uniref:uncharacterized protein n=1 Tax=Sodiomyces alcalophilus JCM 7366 TaxID=591952 RepID=UPI0039B3B5D5